MSRIRSIHPRLWTDEAFMTLSAHARLLFIGLWTEAFDDGVFEWKPLTLKARIFPTDNVDVGTLLEELAANDCVKRMDCEKPAGAIRNFQKFQRPKKPNSSGLLSGEWREYVGAFHTSSEPVENQSGTSPEKSPQKGGREEGRKVEEKVRAPDGAQPSPRDELSKVLDSSRADAVLEARARMRKPLTAYAAQLLAKQFAAWPDPNEAADAMVANGWQGFKPEYLSNRARGSPQVQKTKTTADYFREKTHDAPATVDASPRRLPGPA